MAGILVSLIHYLALASIYSSAGEKDTFADRATTAQKAFLYEHWVMFSALGPLTFANISEKPERLPMIERNARFFMDEKSMAKYALALAENGKLEQAQRIVYSLRNSHAASLAQLLSYCESAGTQGCAGILALNRSPSPPTISAR